ncbi:hypothetical protein [Sphaerisporangium perillae]|uniref:hypothetical protein n=1 Tax=Sphaerisporangium perillae TaxID=2935860 RepID=UPI00200C3E9D|nr:hypothetical protein [Sphaerisporangium perillae]
MRSTTRLYQAVLRDRARPIWVRLHRAFSQWGEDKGFPAADAARQKIEHELAGARLSMERRDGCGRYVLAEPLDGGRLCTKAIFLDGTDRTPGWVLVTVEQEGGTPTGAKAPGFLPAYLRTERITDGAIHLEDAAVVFDEPEMTHFMRILTEPRRRAPIAVVTPDAGSAARAEWLAAAVAGAALVVRLADRHTEELFNQAVGKELGVYSGAIRTYAAPFDPATERNTYRHPPMRPAKLRDEGEAALATIADGMLGRAAGVDLPDEVRRSLPVVLRVLAGRSSVSELASAMDPRPAPPDAAREELRRKMMALTVRRAPAVAPAPPAGPIAEPVGDPVADPAAVAAKAAPVPVPDQVAPVEPRPELAHEVADLVVKKVRDELDSALELAADLDATQRLLREVRTLGLRLDGVLNLVITPRDLPEDPEDPEDPRVAYALLQEEYAEAVDTVRTLTERVRWLERELAGLGHPMYGVPAPEVVFRPGSLAETLVEARSRLTHVVIGDTDPSAVRLDLTYPGMRRTWAGKAWDALHALNDFARARSSGAFSRGFYDWCAVGDPGRYTVPAGMLVMRESKSVTSRDKFRDPRTFPVPVEVDARGEILMEAHVRLRAVGYPAPRMYFHDDSGGATGKVYVGYLGAHLPNTRTN